MTHCDNCGRATMLTRATTFPDNDVVICNRRGCETVGAEAALVYYEVGTDNLRRELGL